MKDSQAIIVKAFLAALTQQQEPLPDEVQAALNKLGKTLDVDELDHLAHKHPPLLTSYEEAYDWLNHDSSQRSKGRDFVPDATSEKENTTNSEIDNASSDIKSLNSLPEILSKIEQRLDGDQLAEIAPQIFSASNSVESAIGTIFPLI